MSSTSAVSSKIFWPSHISSSACQSGYIVGWNIRSFIVCVATVVCNVPLAEVEERLSQFSCDPMFAFINSACAVPPIVLGVWISEFDSSHSLHDVIFNSDEIAEKKQSANIWMTIEREKSQLPILRSVYSCGYKYNSASTDIIVYCQPNAQQQQFLSISPISLDMSPYAAFAPTRTALAVATSGTDSIALPKKEENTMLQRRMSLHTAHTHSIPSHITGTLNEMDRIINQINYSSQIEAIVRTARKQVDPVGLETDCDREEEEEEEEEERQPLHFISKLKVPLAVIKLLMLLLFLLRFIAEVILRILDVQLPHGILSGVTLKDLSTTAVQTHLRLQQCCFWPWQYSTLRTKQFLTETTRIQRLNFLNTMWLVINDMIIGVALGYFLICNAHIIAKFLQSNIQYSTIDHVETMVRWLMGWPSGIKLNNNLDAVYGNLCLCFMALWKVPYNFLIGHLPTIIYFIGFSGILGATLLISLLADLLALFGFHIWLAYSCAAFIYNWQLGNLLSLFHLFRGQKRNVLRHRVDSCEYDLEQLLLGTVLFTVLFFLFPTTLAYYLLFAAMRLEAIVIQVIFESVLALLNHFPIFYLSLVLKDPTRLPGGIYYEMCSQSIFAQKPPSTFVRWRSTLWSIMTHCFPHSADTVLPLLSRFENILLVALRLQQPSGPRMKTVSFAKSVPSTSSPSKSSPPGRRQRHVKSISVGSWQASTPQQQQTTYLIMKTRLLPLPIIFFQYTLLAKRLLQHFKPAYIIRSLVYGSPVEPVCKLQYPLIPDSRPSLEDFWLFLCESFDLAPS